MTKNVNEANSLLSLGLESPDEATALATTPGADSVFAFSRSIGVLLEDGVHSRLIESAAVPLELSVIDLPAAVTDLEPLLALELIIADDEPARRICALLAERNLPEDASRPTIIVVRPEQQPDSDRVLRPGDGYDTILRLPRPPGEVSAQLGLILYAHRAFARRLQDALEELQFNRSIFRSVTSGISVASALEPDLPLTYVNPAFEVITGYAFEEIVGQNCRFLQKDDTSQAARALLREAIRDGREVTVLLRNFRKDGTSFWNELSLSPIRNRAGEITHFVGIQNDVTGRIEMEALRETGKAIALRLAQDIQQHLTTSMHMVSLVQRMEISTGAAEVLRLVDSELQQVKTLTTS